MKFQGLYAVLVTPFLADGELDETSLGNLVEFYIQKQVYGLVVLSVLGEEAELTPTERLRVAKLVFKFVSGRLPVVVGVSGEAVSAIEFGLLLAELGVSGLLVIPPALSALAEVKQHYQRIGTGTQIPLVILDYPPLTGKLPVAFLQSLVEEVEQVQAIKLEEEPTSEKIRQLRAAIGERLHILGGQGGLYILPELQAGSEGLMTGYAYPEHLLKISNYFYQGKLSEASKEYQRWLPLIKYEQQGGVAVRKEILRRRGVISSARTRASAAVIDEPVRKELDRILGVIESISD